MSEVVQMRVQDGVALLTLNRPDRLNAWTAEMEHAYFAMLDQCAREQEVRVIVVTGAGRGFCAGADMQELQAIGDGTLTATAETHERRAQTLPAVDRKADHRRRQRRVRRDRPGAGAHVRHALRRRGRQADDRVRPPRAGGRARHLVDAAQARRTGPCTGPAPSGRVVLAEEAHALGLVNRVSAPEKLLDETLDYARELVVNCSPASMATMKRQLYADLDRALPDALAEANRLMFEFFAAPDFVEGVTSFLEHRDPRFAPLGV